MLPVVGSPDRQLVEALLDVLKDLLDKGAPAIKPICLGHGRPLPHALFAQRARALTSLQVCQAPQNEDCQVVVCSAVCNL